MYLITNRLNQDIFKKFFFFIRSNGSDANQPSTLDFKYEIKRYILGKFSTLFYANV